MLAKIATTALPNSLKLMKIQPTEIERLHGRLMRGPDHPGGDGGNSDAGGDNGDAGADKAAPDTGADGGSDAGDAGGNDDTSLLGGAKADAGAGDQSQSDKGDGQDGGDNQDKADSAPEAYNLTVTTKDAEGNEAAVEIDKVLLDEATPILKGLNLTNDQANQLAPLAVKVQERMLSQQADDFTAIKASWAKEAKADSEIGGAKWAETEALAARGLDTLGFPQGSPFRKLLDESGLGNNPDMIRAWRRVGEKLGEDRIEPTDALKAIKPDRLEALYPDDVPKNQKQGVK